jgi:hypothetical protein
MPSVRTLLFITLSVLGLVFLVRWLQQIRGRQENTTGVRPSFLESAVGFVTNFFDTLGIGSFAPTTSIYKLKNMVSDEHIPGTMHIGHTPPVIIQAFIFIAIIQIDMTTLVSMITAAVLGDGVENRTRRGPQLGVTIQASRQSPPPEPAAVGRPRPPLVDAVESNLCSRCVVNEFNELRSEPEAVIARLEVDIDRIIGISFSDYVNVGDGWSRLPIHLAFKSRHFRRFRQRRGPNADVVSE